MGIVAIYLFTKTFFGLLEDVAWASSAKVEVVDSFVDLLSETLSDMTALEERARASCAELEVAESLVDLETKIWLDMIVFGG